MHIIAQSYDGQYILEGIVPDGADLDDVFTLRETQAPFETLRVRGWLFDCEVVTPETQGECP